jgi:acetyl esterase/lipase
MAPSIPTKAVARWLSLRAYGLVTRALFRAGTPPEVLRRRFERFGKTSRAAMRRRHPTVTFADHAVGSLAIESVCAVEDPGCALLYLHGGAFVMGSPSSYRSRTVRVSYRCRAEVFVPGYRLAPDHPFPAALEDAVAGDSAGGGLALSLMIRLRELGAQQPAGAVLLSPWTDLSDPGKAARRDLWLSPGHLARWARYYVGDANPSDPLVSPALADLSHLAPLLVLVGEDELLLEAARRTVDRARAVGTQASLLVGEGMQHDGPLTLPWLDESRRAWRAIAEFVQQHSQQR